ncbi:MAG: hypothetical protein V9G08_07995 [Dermatophilaceae bacterium]
MRRPSRRVSWALAFVLAVGANAVIAHREWDSQTAQSIRRAQTIPMGQWQDIEVGSSPGVSAPVRVVSATVHNSLTSKRRGEAPLVTPGTAYVVVTMQCRCPVGDLLAPMAWVVDDTWREWTTDSMALEGSYVETAHGVEIYQVGEAGFAVDGVTTFVRVVPVALGATGLRPAFGRSAPAFLVVP